MLGRDFYKRGVVLLLLGLTAVPAGAESTNPDGWRFGAHLDLWGSTIRGDTASGNEIDVAFKEIDNNQLAAMGTLSAAMGKWLFKADLTYLNTQDTSRSTSAPLGIPLQTKVGMDLQAFVTTLLGGYRAYERDAFRLDLMGGVRRLWLQADTDVRISGPNQTIRRSASESNSVWDGVVGFRTETDLTDKWYTTFYGDVGTGDSDYTWQVLWTIDYRFKSLDGSLGYRHLEHNFDKGAALDDIEMRGPFAGVKFGF